jgi:hypothetical protein
MDDLAQARSLLRMILTFSKIYFRKVPLFPLLGIFAHRTKLSIFILQCLLSYSERF